MADMPPERSLLLLVDDQPANLHLLAGILRDDYRVMTTTRGAEVMELACGEPQPDLILLDVRMPDVNGIEVLRLLRASVRSRDIPVMLVSADDSEQTQVTALDCGADDYVVKPLQPLVLAGRVRNLLRRKHAEDELEEYRQHLEDIVAERTAALTVARDAAEAADRAKSAFLANMSHEFRTPLNAILGMAYLVRRGGVTPRQAEQLDRIDGAGRHLVAIVDDVLDLARIEAGGVVLDGRDFALPELVQEIATAAGESARAKGLALDIDMTGMPQALHGDPARLKRVLLNYAGNAVKFTARGSVTIRGRKLAETGADYLLRFEVTDTGIGIPAEATAKLFAPFQQVDASLTRTHGGSGLGLAIIGRIASLMGGDVGVDSTPGQGSTFWLTVRLAKPGSGAAAVPAVDVR